MCGLAGVLNDEISVDSLLDKIAHRGQDGRGTYKKNNLQLGHLRLAIQDLSQAATQPMTVNGTTAIYNGEAWNTRELKEKSQDQVWRSNSDTEPIIVLLAKHGAEALNFIDGMFAIAWTNEKGTWIARDRYGKIPLYFCITKTGIIFASEIKAFPKFYRAQAVKAGTAINIETKEIIYWVKEIEATSCSPDLVLKLLKDGIKQRLLSDRPLCFLLSGGLDSSLILTLARDLIKDPVAYTSVLDLDSPDLAAARRIATELDVKLIEVQIPKITATDIRKAVFIVENPMKAQIEIALAQIPLMEAISSDGFKVVLSGEAADELFCGYGNMQIAAAGAKTDSDYQNILKAAVNKMSRGNFVRVNKVMMSAGIEGRLPFMEERLVASVLNSTKKTNPPNKKVLKEAAEGILPKWLINRKKETFQGATGISKEVSNLIDNPIRYYNSEAKSAFGFLPKN